MAIYERENKWECYGCPKCDKHLFANCSCYGFEYIYEEEEYFSEDVDACPDCGAQLGTLEYENDSCTACDTCGDCDEDNCEYDVYHESTYFYYCSYCDEYFCSNCNDSAMSEYYDNDSDDHDFMCHTCGKDMGWVNEEDWD